ncbi:MAG: hypothetical protein Q8Q60_02385 [Candidatus Chromulinivorax sp.]|nr:hypothetical protein [Candidatus Chromulinivorax sp.]
MKKELSILNLSRAAWAEFCKEWVSWILLSAGGIMLMMLSGAAEFYMPEYRHIAPLVLCLPVAIFTAMLHQNGLDAAYGRKLSLLRMTHSILFASLFFIAISLYNPFPEELNILLFSPENFQLWMIGVLVVDAVMFYLLVRCMFVGMIILEEKIKVLDAFRKSFTLTAPHIFLLLGLFLFLSSVLLCSGLTIIGYILGLELIRHNLYLVLGEFFGLAVMFMMSILMFIGYCTVLSYTILMKTLLFKKLNGMNK